MQERMTSERVNGIKSGYWSPARKEELVQRLAEYENIGTVEECREAFAALDVVRIYAEPYAYNTGSRRVLEKCGFTLEGTLRQSVCKNGRMLDSCIYALLREELEG